MNDPKDLIDGLFNSMVGDEKPEADQPETAECPVCGETFLAGTANESGWCEDCEGNWPPEHQEPADTVGAPILKIAPHAPEAPSVDFQVEAYKAAHPTAVVTERPRPANPCPDDITHLEDLVEAQQAEIGGLREHAKVSQGRVRDLELDLLRMEARFEGLLAALANAIHTAR